MPLQELMESFLGVAGGNNITGEASVVTNVVKQLFGIVQDLCFTLLSGEVGSWVTIVICNGCGGGVASVSLSRSVGLPPPPPYASMSADGRHDRLAD